MLRVVSGLGFCVSLLYAAYQAMAYGGWVIAVVTAYFSGKAMALASMSTKL